MRAARHKRHLVGLERPRDRLIAAAAVAIAFAVPVIGVAAVLLGALAVLRLGDMFGGVAECNSLGCLAVFTWIGVRGACVGLFAAALIATARGVAGIARAPAPDDAVEVRRSRAPALFRRLDDVADACGVSRVERVLISSQCNAAVERSLAFLPGQRATRLIIGLPLLEALPEEELISVVAHEFGHIANDGAWSGALARATALVAHVATALARVGLAGLGARYSERWLAASAPARMQVSRSAEWLADASSARVVGVETAAAALIRSTIVTRAEAAIQRKACDRVRTLEAPDVRPDVWLRRWQSHFERRRNRSDIVRAALIWRTGHGDSHPVLADRLAALGATPRMPPPMKRAASELLGVSLAVVRARVYRAWRGSIERSWTETHQQMRWLARRLRELDRQARAASLTGLEVLERADIAWRLLPPHAAIGPIREAIGVAGTWPLLTYRLATCLTESGDEEGFWLMLELAEHSSEFAGDAAAAVADRLARDGDLEQAHAFVRRRERELARERSAERRPASMADASTLSPPRLSEQARRLLLACVEGHAAITSLHAAQHMAGSGDPTLLLVADSIAGLSDDEARLMRTRIDEQLALLPFKVMLVGSEKQRERRCRRLIRSLPGSRIVDLVAGSFNEPIETEFIDMAPGEPRHRRLRAAA